MDKMKVLFVMQEMLPYMPETAMSVRGLALPQGIHEKGKEIRTFMPRYGIIKERRHQLHEVIRLSGMNIIIDDTDHSLIIKVGSIQPTRMQVYFIDSEDYFQRKAVFRDENGNFFEDNDERIIFFSRGVLETVKKLRWSPDIIHCQGWLSALVPVYLKKFHYDDPLFTDTKIVTVINKDQFEETLNSKMKKKSKLPGITDKDLSFISTPNYTNLMKLAVKYSDGVILEDKENEINPELIKYVKNTRKPTLSTQDEDNYVEKYAEFYESLLSK